LVASGHQIRVLSRSRASENGPGNPEYITGDLLDVNSLERVVDGMEVCIHSATTTVPSSAADNIEFDINTNLIGSIRLMEAASAAGVSRLIFISSGGTVYGDTVDPAICEDHPTEPISAYGIVKLAIEKYLSYFHATAGLDYRIARLSNPYGHGQNLDKHQGIIPIFINRILADQPVQIWGDGLMVRDYIYIDDAVAGLMALIQSDGNHFRVYNIGAGVGSSINDIVDAISASVGRVAKRIYLPARGFDVKRNVLDVARARVDLGWSAKIDLQQGIDETVKWYSSQS
jgi:UDP-glucose 4-epimerase